MIQPIEKTNDITYLKRENKRKDFANKVLYNKLKQSESKVLELEKKFNESEIKKKEDKYINVIGKLKDETVELHNAIVGLKLENKYYQKRIKEMRG